MNYNIINFIIMITVFVSYLAYIVYKYGVQTSISDSYYRLPKKINYLFTLFCWGYAIPAMMIGTSVSPLMFLAGAGICFVGAAPNFRGIKQENRTHMISAMVAVLASQIAILFSYGYWQINMAFLFACLILTYIPTSWQKYNTWWQEIFAFISISAAYAIQLFN